MTEYKQPKFEIFLLREAENFISSQNQKTIEKITSDIEKVRTGIDSRAFKKLNNEIWEFRTFYGGKFYRLLSFWDKRDSEKTLMIITHGFQKKTAKTPINELKKALASKKRYFETEK